MVKTHCTESRRCVWQPLRPSLNSSIETLEPTGGNGLAQNRSVRSGFLFRTRWACVSRSQPYSLGWVTKASSVAAYSKQPLSFLQNGPEPHLFSCSHPCPCIVTKHSQRGSSVLLDISCERSKGLSAVICFYNNSNNVDCVQMLTVKAGDVVTCLGSHSGDFCLGQPVSLVFKALVNLQWQF